MSEGSEGNPVVSPEDRAKAQTFFDKGRAVASTGNFDYAIEMFIQGLALDPQLIDVHQELRDISLKRKASGGKKAGGAGFSMKRNDEKQNMLDAERSLAFDPGNTDHMQKLLQSAARAELNDVVMWIGPIFQRANLDQKKPEFNKFIVLREVYKSLKQWRLAGDACFHALNLRPNDMELPTEMKNLMAMSTMEAAGYSKGGNFGAQVRDKEKQARLAAGDRDVIDIDTHRTLIAAVEAELKAQPNDPGKAMKLVDALERTDDSEFESRAVDLLQEWFDKTKQFRYRQRIGHIHMRQLTRMERGKREALTKDPDNAELRKEYLEFKKEQHEFELKEYELAVQAYPTEMKLRYEMARRMFVLGRYSDSIPVFQQVRNDPKYKFDAGILLACSFLEAGYVDEADETLANMIREYTLQGDSKSKEMYYWRGRALEQKKMNQEAIAHYSKVAQFDFNYRDVQARIKKLRGS